MISEIFKAYDVRAIYPDPLNESAAYKVGFATARFLKNTNNNNTGGGGTVLVSRDMRPSSPQMADALIHGLRAADMPVIDLGMCDTSFMYFAINHVPGAIGGVQTTASHNPIEYNGFKISRELAKPVGADTGLLEIQKIAEALDDEQKQPTAKLSQLDLWKEYRKHILNFYTPPKRPLKIFIDASNGMAGKLIPQVFNDLDNLTILDVNFEITGSFVHEPNPLVAENMIPTQQGVQKHNAHIGVCFDGDADRCMITDEKGEIIGCDHLTALLAHHFVKTNPKTTIVYDLRSSKVLEETILALGAVPHRSKVGHVNMKAALRQTNGVFGGELSGHFYFRDNHFADSGAITLAAVLTLLGQTDKPLSELIAPFRKYPQSGEINYEVEDKTGVMKKLEKDFTTQNATVDWLDGVTIDRFDTDSYWFNVRASNTEPLLRLNAEAKDPATLKKLLDNLTPYLGTPASDH